MTAQLLSSDLTALIQDSKRKNPDVRAVCTYHMGTKTLVLANVLLGR